MNDAKNVTTAAPKIGGAIYTAPKGTTLPTDATTELGAAFKCLGFVSEDGLKNNEERSTQDIKAWGGTVVDSSQTEHKDSFTFTLIEATNTDVLKAVHGAENVTTANGETIVTVDEKPLTEAVWVVDMVLKDNHVKRIVIPAGKITAVGEVSYVATAAVGYACTLAAFPGTDGWKHKEYIK